jgi:hypothetical protein
MLDSKFPFEISAVFTSFFNIYIYILFKEPQLTQTMKFLRILRTEEVKVSFALQQAKKAQRGEGGLYSFFNRALGEGGWLMPLPGLFNPGKET